MNILVLYHTAWMEQMGHSWNNIPEINVELLPLPVDSEEKLLEAIKILPEYCLYKEIDFVLSVNGHGLVFDKDVQKWAPDTLDVPWIEWWWDDPRLYLNNLKAKGLFESWNELIFSNRITNCMWDNSLASEYSSWSGRQWHYIPTATHPGCFHPSAAQHSQKQWPKCDLTFMGSYSACQKKFDDVPVNIANDVKRHCGKNYKELIEIHSDLKVNSPFDKDLMKIKGSLSAILSNDRRAEYINQIADSNISTNFIGFNFPENIAHQSTPVYQPAEMVHIFQNSTVNLDLQNGQSFTGCNMRAYEIMASKAVLACSFNPDFDPHGDLEGKVYLKFDNVEHLQEIINELNSDRRKKAAICRNARNYCVENHSWDNRLTSLLKCIPLGQEVC